MQNIKIFTFGLMIAVVTLGLCSPALATSQGGFSQSRTGGGSQWSGGGGQWGGGGSSHVSDGLEDRIFHDSLSGRYQQDNPFQSPGVRSYGDTCEKDTPPPSVPEPSTWMLLGIGLLGLPFYRKIRG